MTTQYFSHDVNAQHDDKCVALLTTLGWKGYGVYWGIVERMHEREGCRLAYNTKALAWSLHVTEKFLIRVITEFNLFAFSEDGTEFWSESAVRRQGYRKSKYAPRKPKAKTETETNADQPKRKRGRPRKYPLPESTPEPEQEKKIAAPIEAPTVEEVRPEIERGSQTPAERPLPKSEAKESSKAFVPEPYNAPDEEPIVPQAESIVESDESVQNAVKVPFEQIIALWNQKFTGTRQTYRGFYLDAISYQRATQTLSSGYTLDDFERAFQIARNDSFNWLLKDVLKQDNLQRLLVKGDKQNERKDVISGTGFNGQNSSGGSSSNWLPDGWKKFIRTDRE